jgi:hypothetical protein
MMLEGQKNYNCVCGVLYNIFYSVRVYCEKCHAVVYLSYASAAASEYMFGNLQSAGFEE